VFRARTTELAKLFCAPNLGNVVLVVECLDSAANVGAEAVLFVPEWTLLVKKVQAIVGEVVGCTSEVIDGRLDFCVESFESSIGGAGIVNDGFRGDLEER
jgi:hypothetical protein